MVVSVSSTGLLSTQASSGGYSLPVDVCFGQQISPILSCCSCTKHPQLPTIPIVIFASVESLSELVQGHEA